MMLFDALPNGFSDGLSSPRELQKSDTLLRRFEEIHNHLYANDGLSPEQALEEMTKLLFLKIDDERRKAHQFYCDDDEWSRIASTNTAPALTERLTTLFDAVKQHFPDVFDSNDRLKLSVNALAWAVRALQHISLTDSANDAKGLAFQKFLANRDKAGRGQFFTPQPVIDFCIRMIRPEAHEIVIDPACGSGGFLLSALGFLRKNAPSTDTVRYVADNLVGYDISAGIARLAQMQLLLETDTSVHLHCQNTLECSAESIIAAHPIAQERGGFDIVVANPPFGTMGKITNRRILATFELGHKWTAHGNAFHRTSEILSGQVTEVLFVERCLSLLCEGGRMAIVLPNGHFENSSLAYVREFIKQKAQILAIVHLPQDTFIPFGTGVKTSLLFLEKSRNDATSRRDIFFGTITQIGYMGNKNATPTYKKDAHGKPLQSEDGEPILEEDYTALAEAYHAVQRGENIDLNNAYTLASEQLNGRFDYDFYAPHNRALITHLQSKNAVRLGDIVDIIREKSPLLQNAQAQVEYLELSDINTNFFEIIATTPYTVHELPSRASYELREGDILTAVAGNSLGTSNHATALAMSEHAGCICTNGFRVLRNPRIDRNYLLWYLKTEFFLKQVFMLRTGAAIPSLSDVDLANILVYLPPEKEMKSVASSVQKALRLREAAREELRAIRLVLV